MVAVVMQRLVVVTDYDTIVAVDFVIVLVIWSTRFCPVPISAVICRRYAGQSSVDSGEIRWGGSSQYQLHFNNGVVTWNAINPINIEPDTIFTIEDLHLSDVNCGCYPWSGAWQQNTGADSLFFNQYGMAGLSTSQKNHVATHEIGHALGLAHSISGNVMYTGAYETSLGTQDQVDYHYLWGY